MPQVTMPDGTVVEMPDQIDPELGARLRAFQQSQSAPSEPVPAGGRRGRGRPDVAAERSLKRTLPWYAQGMDAEDNLASATAQADAAAFLPDLALTMGTGAVTAPIGNALGLLSIPVHAGAEALGMDPQWTPEGVRESIPSWQPRTAAAQQLLQSAEPVIGEESWEGYGRGAADTVGADPSGLLGDVAGYGARAVPEAAMSLLGIKGFKAAAPQLANMPVSDAIRSLKPAPSTPDYAKTPVAGLAKRGYEVHPLDVRSKANLPSTQPVTGETRARFGPAVTQSEMPLKNAATATANATADMKETLGVRTGPTGAVDEVSLTEAISKQSTPYQQIARDVPPVAGAPNTLAQRIGEAWSQFGESLKADPFAASKLRSLADPNAPPMSSAQILELWKQANSHIANLRKAVGDGKADARIRMQDIRQISDALLDELDARATAFGYDELVPQLKDSRVNIARLHTLRDSLDSGGFVDARSLAKMAENEVPLTGGLAEVAADARIGRHTFGDRESAVAAGAGDAQVSAPATMLQRAVGRFGGNAWARSGIRKLNEELRRGSGLLQPEPSGMPPAPLLLQRQGRQGDLVGGGLDDVNQGLARAPGQMGRLPPSPMPTEQMGAFGPLMDLSPAPGRVGIEPTQFIGGRPVGTLDDIARELGPSQYEFPGLNVNMAGAAMPDRPRGVSGPESAQLGAGRPLPFQLLRDPPQRLDDSLRNSAGTPPEPPRLQPEIPPLLRRQDPEGPLSLERGIGSMGDDPVATSDFLRQLDQRQGIGEYTPESRAPVVSLDDARQRRDNSPSGEHITLAGDSIHRQPASIEQILIRAAQDGDISSLLNPDGGLSLYRGAGRANDPYTSQNISGATHWTPDSAATATYGERMGQLDIPPEHISSLFNAGDEANLYRSLGLDPENPQTYRDVPRLELLRRYFDQPDAAQGVAFSQATPDGPSWEFALRDELVRRLLGE